jgi:hypothetical protein
MAISEIGSNTNTGNSNAPTITHGLTISADDLLVIILGHNSSTGFGVGSSGFTLDHEFVSNSAVHGGVFTKIAGGSEPSSYTLSSGTNDWTLLIRQFRGVKVNGTHAEIFDVDPTVATASSAGTSTPLSVGTITTAYDNALAIFWGFVDSSTITFAAPDNSYGTVVKVDNDSVHRSTISAIRQIASASTSVGTTTCSIGSGKYWGCGQFALRAAAAGAPSTPHLLSSLGVGG